MADAVRVPSFPETGLASVIHIVWTGLDADDTGLPVKTAKYADKCVQIYGTFDTTTVTMQGSCDERADPDHVDHASAVWFSLVDPQGNAIAKTAAGAEQVLENPLWIRPSVSGGASTSITVALVAKKTM